MFSKFPLIPRAKVNYTYGTLLRSLFIRETQELKYTKLFKSLLCEFFGTSNIALTSSGRSALFVILSSLKQHKVIIPSYTCKAVSEAALFAGKEIIYIEINLRDYNINSENLNNVLDEDCIVIATHQYGHPCDIKQIAAQCQAKGAVLIEDCAASFGTKIDGVFTGCFGDFSFFSFDSTKTLTIPSKGGCIITKKADDIIKIEQEINRSSCTQWLKSWSSGLVYLLLESKYIYRCFHYLMLWRKGKCQLSSDMTIDLQNKNFYQHLKLAEWQAYIATDQMKNISQIIGRRKYLFQKYDQGIKDIDYCKKPIFLQSNCNIKYAIMVNDKKRFYEQCVKHGVDCAFSFSYIVCPSHFATAKLVSTTVINLPLYYKLTNKECDQIIQTVNHILKNCE